MNSELLIVFVFLLLGLILCSYLGGHNCLEGMENNSSDANATTNTNTASVSSVPESSYPNSYDNYNHYDGTSVPIMFYGPDGGTAKVIKTQNNNTLVITDKNGTTNIYYINKNTNDTTISEYHGPNGGSAKIITGSNGKKAVEITTPNGNKIIYTDNNMHSYSQDETINQYDGASNSTGTDYNTAYNTNYNGQQTNTVTGPGGNTYSTYDSSAYYNSLPQGIPRSQIVPGEEDLYILKSQVVPPVCPACPAPIVQSQDNNDTTKCPPCPSCSRCPEPAFSCEKVPNYKAFNPDYMPVPVLSDFSGFGM